MPGRLAACTANASVVRQNPGGMRNPNDASRLSEAALPPIRSRSTSASSSQATIGFDARAEADAVTGARTSLSTPACAGR